jgi:hypothetical protein
MHMSGDLESRSSTSSDVHANAGLPRRLVRMRRTASGLELYYPPLRSPQVAIPLALFGALACALPALGAGALLPFALASTAGALTAVLIGVFIAPFAIFGVVLVMQALHMLAHSLRVHVSDQGIIAAPFVFGVPLRARELERSEIASIEPRIPTRHQSLFSAEPIYQLVAWNAARTRCINVAESLRGEALMLRVKAAIEEMLGMTSARPAP